MLRKFDDSSAWNTLNRELEDHLLIKGAIMNARSRLLEPLPGFMRLEFSPDQFFYREILEKHMAALQGALVKCFGKEFRAVLVRPPPRQK
jgi:hypothetical protein